MGGLELRGEVRFVQKAAAIILRNVDGREQLLVHSFADNPSLPWRFPGGGVENENIEQELLREIREEAGIENAIVIRKLGVQKYFKAYLNCFVERHDFLLRVMDEPRDSWMHTVAGSGSDAEEIFDYHWISSSEIYRIDPELQKFLDEKHLPELFRQCH